MLYILLAMYGINVFFFFFWFYIRVTHGVTRGTLCTRMYAFTLARNGQHHHFLCLKASPVRQKLANTGRYTPAWDHCRRQGGYFSQIPQGMRAILSEIAPFAFLLLVLPFETEGYPEER